MGTCVAEPDQVVICRNAMGGVKLIAKIESTEGLLEYQKILDACDAVIVSRGSLGVDLPAEKVFRAQKMLIKAANMAGKVRPAHRQRAEI